MNTAAVLTDIARCKPELASSIRAFLGRRPHDAVITDFEVISTRSGEATVRVAGRLLHSSVAPNKEAQRLVQRALAEEHDAVVVFGTGLGYHLEELRKQEPALPVILVEPSPELMKHALSYRSHEWWCRYGPDLVCAPEEEDLLSTTLRRLGVYKPASLVLGGMRQLYERETELSGTVLEQYRHRRSVNRNTLRRFGKLWVRNTLKNLFGAEPRPGIDHLAGTANGIPALVCGAGPTLDLLQPYLAPLSKRCLVIAVDTALTVLQRIGVTPDFAVVADPQYWNTRHLDALRFSEQVRTQEEATILVSEPATHPRVFRLWRGPCVVSASLFPLGSFIDTWSGRSRKLGAGGSVATSAWDLARIMGSSEIFLAGIDLGFPGNLTHCRGSFFEERMIIKAERLLPAEQSMFRYLHDAQPRPVPAARADEPPVLSDSRMAVYRSWFAEQQRLHPGVHTALLSTRSSAIAGVDVYDPREVLRRLAPIEKRWNATRPEPSRAKREALRRALLASVDGIADVAREGLRACEELEKTATLNSADLNALDRVDQKLARCPERELAGFLAEDTLEQATGMTVRSARDAVEQARRLYTALVDSCLYHRTLILRYR